MDKRLVKILALAGGAVGAIYLAEKYLRPSAGGENTPTGSLSVASMASGSTVTVTLTATASGTKPITVSGTMEVYDITSRELNRKVTGWDISGTIYGDERFTVIKQFEGVPGHTYSITAQVTFSNQYGTDTKSASTRVTVPGQTGTPPSGSLSITASVG